MNKILVLLVFIMASVLVYSCPNGMTQTYNQYGHEITGGETNGCIRTRFYTDVPSGENASSYCRDTYNASYINLGAGQYLCSGGKKANRAYLEKTNSLQNQNEVIEDIFVEGGTEELEQGVTVTKPVVAKEDPTKDETIKESVEENIASEVQPFKSLGEIEPNVKLCLRTKDSLDSDDVWIEYRPSTQNTQTVVLMGNNQQNQQAAQNKMKELESQCLNLDSDEPVVLNPNYKLESRDRVEDRVSGMKVYRSDCRDRRSDDSNPLLAKVKPCNTNQIKDSIKLKAICSKLTGREGLTKFGHHQGEADFIPIKASSSIASGVSQPSAGASGLGCKGTPNAEDYDHCRKSVNAYNAFGTAESALQVIHNLKMQSTRTQLQQQVAESEGNSLVAREVQIRDLRQQFAHNNQMTALYATQSGAVLTKAVIGWPTIANLGDKHKSCDKSEAEASCCQLVADESPREVMPNQSLKGYFAQLTAALSSKILQLQMRNNEIIEQLKQLGDNVADLPQTDTGINTLATYCQSPEGQADTVQCAGVLGGPSGQATGFNSFGGGVGFAATDLSDLSGSKQIANLGQNDEFANDQSTIGNGLQDFDNKVDNSGFIDNPRGASFGQGNGASGGGAGGGGGGAGGGSGPGLSQKPSTRQGIKDALTKIQEGGSYASSGKGFYKSSGKRKRRNSRRGGSNKSRRNLSELGGLLSKRSNQKSPVGPKNIAIFEQISDRYEAVSEQGRVR